MTDCGAILVMKEEVGAKQVGTNTATAHMEPREQDTCTNTSPPSVWSRSNHRVVPMAET